jgi:xanthine dehydrogenase accessory factor
MPVRDQRGADPRAHRAGVDDADRGHRAHLRLRRVDDKALRWLREPRELALALLAGFDGSAPVATGAYAFVDRDGELAGDLAGGAIDVSDVARTVLAGGPAQIEPYPISDERAQRAGLSCGGVAHVLIAPVGEREPHVQAQQARLERRPHALAYRLTDGAAVYVDAERVVGSPAAEDVVATARELLARGRPGERRLVVGEDSPLCDADVEVHVVAHVPAPRMFVLGAIDISIAVAEGGQRLGYELTVVEPRAGRDAIQRAPGQVSTEDPAEMIARQSLTERDAVLIFTHDLALDVPAVQAAFAAGAGYVGALGGRKTTENRHRALLEAGVSEQQLARLHAPAGLDLGAGTPEESAVSILAEVLAHRAGRDPRPLSETRGSIRA